MARLRYNNQSGSLGSDPGISGTTITFAKVPKFATITGSDYIPIALDAGLPTYEIVYLTAYTAGSLTGTISRAAEDSTNWPAVAHPTSATTGTWGVDATLTDFGTGTAGTLVAANNLSDVSSAATSRTNLGLGTAALQASSYFNQTANNLSDVANAATARTNLGLTPVLAPNASGDVTGATDYAALTALAADGVTIVLRPYQTYYVTSLPNITPRRGIKGIGLSTVVMHTGSGPCLTIQNPNTFSSSTVWVDNMAGENGGFIIDGTNHAAGASCGVQVSDIYALSLKDIVVRNYAGTTGWLGGTPANQTVGTTGATLTSIVGGNLSLGGVSTPFPSSNGQTILGVVSVPTSGGTALLGYTARGTNQLQGISIISGTGSWTVAAGTVYLNRIGGDAGIWFNNVSKWTERMFMENVATQNCQNAAIIDATTGTASHEYSFFDIGIHALTGQNGIVVQGGVHLNGTLRSYGNYEKGTGNTGAANVGTMLIIDPDGQNATLGSVASPGAAMTLDIHGEADGTGTAHTSIFFGPNAVVSASGIFYLAGLLNGNVTLPNANFSLSGILHLNTALANNVQGQAFNAIGSVTATSGFKSGNGTSTLGGTLWSGSGVPNIPASVAGDFYFNTAHAGGTTNIYIATAANTWTALV